MLKDASIGDRLAAAAHPMSSFGVKSLPMAAALSRLYVLVALLLATLLVPVSISLVAAVLFAVQLYLVYRPAWPGMNLAMLVITLVLLPWTMQELVGAPFSILLIIPVAPFFSYSLAENASRRSLFIGIGSWSVTLVSLLTVLCLMLVAAVVLPSVVLGATALVGGAYLGALAAFADRQTRGVLVQAPQHLRLVSGTQASFKTTLRGQSKAHIHVFLKGLEPWVTAVPDRIQLRHDTADVEVTVTPPLSGPSSIRFQATVLDNWGLVRKSQEIEVAALNVIPRARYAEWLARKYLEQTGSQFDSADTVGSASARRWEMQGGVEYHDSRPYQAGDAVRNIDWRHTSKLMSLIVKEFREAHAQAMVISLNLVVTDPEEADELVYDLITLALTVAGEGIKAAIVAYDDQEVREVRPAMDPRDVVKAALRLSQDIRRTPPMQRFLQPPDVMRLVRILGQLERVESEPAQKLGEMLRLEKDAVEAGAKGHPASRALMEITGSLQPPAVIAVVSRWNHDAEALSVVLGKLNARGFRSMAVRTRNGRQLSRGGGSPPVGRLVLDHYGQHV